MMELTATTGIHYTHLLTRMALERFDIKIQMTTSMPKSEHALALVRIIKKWPKL